MSTPAPGTVTEKKKRVLPAALKAHQFQKGHKRATKPAAAPATPAASPQPAVAAANAGAATVRPVGVLDWLFSNRVAS